MIKDRIIYFDMDGVLDNFRKASNELGIKFNGYAFVDEEKAWEKIHKLGSNFWSNLEWIEGSYELFIYACQMFKHVEILSVSPNREASIGKRNWCCKHLEKIAYLYGTNFKTNIIFSHEKEKFSNGKNILIDDYEENIKKWNGPSILFKNAKQTKIELFKLTEELCRKTQ